jgi:hypothetical protein
MAIEASKDGIEKPEQNSLHRVVPVEELRGVSKFLSIGTSERQNKESLKTIGKFAQRVQK